MRTSLKGGLVVVALWVLAGVVAGLPISIISITPNYPYLIALTILVVAILGVCFVGFRCLTFFTCVDLEEMEELEKEEEREKMEKEKNGTLDESDENKFRISEWLMTPFAYVFLAFLGVTLASATIFSRIYTDGDSYGSEEMIMWAIGPLPIMGAGVLCSLLAWWRAKGSLMVLDVRVIKQLGCLKGVPLVRKPASSVTSPLLSKDKESTHGSGFDGEWRILFPSTNSLIVEIYSANLQRLFHGGIEIAETRKNEKAFISSFNGEVKEEERKRIVTSLSYHPAVAEHNRDILIYKVWHGTNMEKARNILSSGFANLATLDDGWYGKGIYFSTSPEYASHYCKNSPNPCLLMCYVIVFNPFPVLWEDAKSPDELRLVKQANHKNFGCHYVPVSQFGKLDFRPPQKAEEAQYDEIVIFNETHILPFAMVSLGPVVSPSPASLNIINSGNDRDIKSWSCDDVILWMNSLSLSTDYCELIKRNHINGKALLSMKTKEDWNEAGITTFGDVRILVYTLQGGLM